MRVLSVGAGYFAQFHIEAWLAHPEVELVGIVDPDTAKAQALGADVPTFASLEDALHTAPDLIDIATPPHTHLALIESAMAARTPTICQKPFCGGLQHARAAVALADTADTLLGVHENVRFQPWYRAIRAELDAGRLGEFMQATFRLRPGDGQGPDAYRARQPYFREMPRFLIQETGVHWVDTFRYLFGEPFGEPRRVFADLRRLNPGIAGEDAGSFTLDFGDGRRAVFDGNRLADHAATDTRLTLGEALVEGTDATLALDGSARLTRRKHGDIEEETIPLTLGPGFGAGCVDSLQAHVVDHLLRGTTLENRAADYLRNLEIVEAIYRSAQEGRWVDLT